MKAIFETGGKQYYVQEKDIIYVEKLDAEEGSSVVFDKVMMINGATGYPYVSGATVTAKVVKHGKKGKIIVFKYRQKKDSKKKQGHRQPYTKLEITKIAG